MTNKTLDQQIEDDIAEYEKLANQQQPEEELILPTDEEKPADAPIDDDSAAEPIDDQPEVEPVKPMNPPVDEETKRSVADMAYQLREAKRQQQELAAKLEELQQPKQPEKPIEQAPNPEEDPLGYVQYQNRQLAAQVQELSGKVKQTEAERQQNQQYQAAVQEFVGLENQYRTQRPDYDAAATHMRSKLEEATRLLSPGASAEQVASHVSNQILGWASQAARQGINPIAYLDNMARQQYGFTGVQPIADAKPAAKQPDLAKIDKNMKRSVNGLGSGTGSAAKNDPITNIEKMSIAQLDKFATENPNQAAEFGIQRY